MLQADDNNSAVYNNCAIHQIVLWLLLINIHTVDWVWLMCWWYTLICIIWYLTVYIHQFARGPNFPPWWVSVVEIVVLLLAVDCAVDYYVHHMIWCNQLNQPVDLLVLVQLLSCVCPCWHTVSLTHDQTVC